MGSLCPRIGGHRKDPPEAAAAELIVPVVVFEDRARPGGMLGWDEELEPKGCVRPPGRGESGRPRTTEEKGPDTPGREIAGQGLRERPRIIGPTGHPWALSWLPN